MTEGRRERGTERKRQKMSCKLSAAPLSLLLSVSLSLCLSVSRSLLSFNALRAGFDILQRVFSLLNFLFSFAADVLVNFERRRQIGLQLPQTFLLGLGGAVARL